MYRDLQGFSGGKPYCRPLKLHHDKDYEENRHGTYWNECITLGMDSYGTDFVSLQSIAGVINANSGCVCNGSRRRCNVGKG